MEALLERILAELKSLNENVSGLRAEMKTSNKEAMEKAMKDAMGQVSTMFKDTPMGPILASVMARNMAGGKSNG